MTFEEAIQKQPEWVQIWLYFLLVGAFLLPFALLVWRQTRLVGIVTILASMAAGLTIDAMYMRLGYVKLLGLPHVVLWTPVAIWLIRLVGREDIPVWPRRIMMLILATLLISLAFDYVDVARYLLGNRTPTVLPSEG